MQFCGKLVSLVLIEGAGKQAEEEEEKEVDPSLVGSLDNVYTDETEAELNKEDDPFKKVAVSGMTTAAEMEKTVNALVIYSSEHDDTGDCLSPLPDEDPSIERRGEGGEGTESSSPLSPSTGEEGDDPLSADSSSELLPDLVHSPAPSGPGEVQANHSPPSLPPDMGSLPPDLAAESEYPLDLLDPESGMLPSSGSPLDLTEGL